MDLVFVGATIAFAAITFAFVALCARVEARP